MQEQVPVGKHREDMPIAADLGLSLGQKLLSQPKPDGLPRAVRQHLHDVPTAMTPGLLS